MRAFAGGYYNNLKRLYDHLGVRYRSQPFLFEFAKVPTNPSGRRDSRESSYFVHASNLHKLLPPRPSAVATISYLLEVVYLLACYSWFAACCFLVQTRGNGSGSFNQTSETLDQYLKRIRLPKYFVTYYLLPLISSVTTCPHEALLAFPASDLIEYKRRTHGAPHYTVSNGVKSAQDKLAQSIQYELSAMVTTVEAHGNQVRLAWKKGNAPGDDIQEEVFDRVVLAVAPDVVGLVFKPLQRLMNRIPTTLVESVVHRDRSLLESDEAHGDQGNDQAQLIYLRTSTQGTHRTESLHVQPCGAIVTTCPYTPIEPSSIIHSAKFTRVLRSPESQRIVNNLFSNTPAFGADEKIWRNGDGNVWIVGGWCWDGMVLLEGCIVSAMRVADAFGVEVPWRH